MDDDTINQIFTSVFDHCPARRYGAPWRFLKGRNYCRFAPTDSSDLFSALIDEFSAEDLEHVGVVELDDNGQISLVPQLQNKNSPLIFLTKSKEEFFYDVLSRDGCLTGRQFPLEAGLDDFWTRQDLIKSSAQLFAAATMEDVIVLRNLDLPVVLAHGWDGIRHDQILRADEHLHWQNWSVVAAIDDDDYITPRSIVFVNGLSKLSSNGFPTEFLEQLVQLEQVHDLDVRGGIWHPTDKAIETLRFFVHRRDRTGVRKAFLASVDHSTFDPERLLETRLSPTNQTASPLAVHQNLDVALVDPVRKERARQAYEKAIRECVEPMRSAARQSTDAGQGALTSIAAMSLEHLLRMSPRVREEISNGTYSSKANKRRGGLDDYLRMSGQLIAAVRESRK